MKKIFGAIGLGVLAGIAVGGYMAWKKNKKINEEIKETSEGIEKSCDNIEQGLNNVNERCKNSVKEHAEKAFNENLNKMKDEVLENIDKLEETKEQAFQNIKANHEKFDKAIKASENIKDAEIVEEKKDKVDLKAENEKN